MELNVDDFKKLLLSEDSDTIVKNIILTGEALHFDNSKKNRVRSKLCEKYRVEEDYVAMFVVGSAKLGFSISESYKGGSLKHRFRLFSHQSDIDIAVVSPAIFKYIWQELSIYSHKCTPSPWDSGKLGDYMIQGWLRPDHFPARGTLRRCDAWNDCFWSVSSDSTLGRNKIRGGLFYSKDHLIQYQSRGVEECRRAVEALNLQKEKGK